MNFQKLGHGGMDWIDLARDKGHVAGSYGCGNEHPASTKCGEILDYLTTC